MKFSQTTEQTFYDIELFNLVTKELKGRNFYMLQYFQKDAVLRNIQNAFPFVAGISFQMEAKSSLTG